MRELTAKPVPGISASQLHLAAELNIDDADVLSASELIAAIESRLGDRTALECARWFIMSVLRHERQALWNNPDKSDIAREYQYDLAAQCLAAPEFVQSIKTVLKGDSCKYMLVEFRRTRNPRKHILANTTIAYQRAIGILRQAQLLGLNPDPDSANSAHEQSSGLSADITTTNMRRASRRGFSVDVARQDESGAFGDLSDKPGHGIAHATQDMAVVTATQTTLNTGMTAQEYAELERALSRQKASLPIHKSWHRFGDNERRSWLLGLLAGFAAFAAILFIFF